MTNLAQIKKITDLFAHKKWDLDNDKSNYAYSAFVAISKLVDEDVFEHIIDLTKDYLWIGLEQYYLLHKSMSDLVVEIIEEDVSKIAVVPVIAPKDENSSSIKSGVNIPYPLVNHYLRFNSKLNNHDIKYFISPSEFRKSDFNVDGTRLVCVDDFVGTGKTVLDFLIDHTSKNTNIAQKISTIVFVSMQHGIDSIRNSGYDFHSIKITSRGIADNQRILDKNAYYSSIDKIENIINVSKKFRRGYGESEALVSMIRTPNNTFPLYWKRYSLPNIGKEWPAPFKRM